MGLTLKQAIWVGAVASLIYFFFLASQLSTYGLTWDEALYFNSGMSYVEYFSGQPLTVGNISNSANYGPAVDILKSYSYLFFSRDLHLIDPIASQRIMIAFLAALAVFVTFVFANKVYGTFVASLSAFFLATYPHFFAHAHFNAKDIPVAGLFALTLLLYYESIRRKSWPLSIIAGILLGVSFATKFNAIFIPVCIALWYLIVYKHEYYKEGKIILPKKRIQLIVSFLIAIPATIISWPWLWSDTINHTIGIFNHFATVAKGFSVFYYGAGYTSGVNVPWSYPYGYLAVVTPAVVLILSIIGVITLILELYKKYKENNTHEEFDEKTSFSYLILIWFFIVTLKVSFSGLVYDGIRQFFEAIPPLCIFAGIGAFWLFRLAYTFFKDKASKSVIMIIVVVIIMIAYIPTISLMIKIHPYESSYFNEFVGGTSGAVGKFRISYWAEPMKDGIEWLNANAPPRATVSVLEAPHIAKYYLRSDLQLVQGYDGAYIVTLNYAPNVQALYSVVIDGYPILNVYQGPASQNYTVIPDLNDDHFYADYYIPNRK